MKQKTIFILIVTFVVLLITSFHLLISKEKKQIAVPTNPPSGEPVESTPTSKTTTGLANPASVNCTQKGGQLQIKARPDGGQYGLCFFEDNRACEEWALFNGDCPVGGRRTTGFDTVAQKFCAWSGGQTLADDNAICTFKDGSTCPDDAFYEGTCQKGNKTK